MSTAEGNHEQRVSTNASTDTVSDTSTFPPPPNRILQLSVTLSLVIFFFVSVALSIVFWTRYERHHFTHVWDSRTCTILEKKAVEQNGKFRAEFKVTGVAPAADAGNQTAYYGPSSSYTDREVAEEQVESVRTGKSICWVRRANERQISVVEVPVEESGEKYVAWAFTIGGGVCIVLVVASLSFYGGGASGRKEGALSAEQTREVLERFEIQLGKECVVCLEGGGRGVRLPCEHEFHRRCIKRWLMGGSARCPLCNWDVGSLFRDGGESAHAVEGRERAELHADREREREMV